MSLRSRLRVLALVIAAGGLLAADATPATANQGNMFVRLSGHTEVPGPGDPNGRGAAIINVRPNLGRVCAGVRFNRISRPFTGMHIHEGRPGIAGPIVVNLDPILAGDARCVDGLSTELLIQIRQTPGAFYLNLHNQDFPAGAIRGQLNRSKGVPDEFGRSFSSATGPNEQFVRMNGAQEVPGPGDPDGRGVAFISLNPATGQVCADVRWRSIDPVTGMHIHTGGRGASGAVVIGFISPGPGTRCTTADTGLVQDISDNPGSYYLNVHTDPFPAGAIRGQLQHSNPLAP